MKPPYEECHTCIATPWCKRYSGEVPKPDTPSWCNPKFRLYKALQLAEIPKEYLNANIYNYVVDKHNEEIYKALKPIIDNIVEEVDNGINFFFYNSVPGTGKTFHAAMILNHYIYKTCLTSRFDFENPLALYVVYAELMDDLRYRREDEEVQRKIERIKNVPLLLLDDVGSGTTSKYTIEQTYLILNHRFNHRLSTIVTSNLEISQLRDESILGERNVSRIIRSCIGVNVKGPDRRIKSVRGAIK